jgi:hypothetical protein
MRRLLTCITSIILLFTFNFSFVNSQNNTATSEPSDISLPYVRSFYVTSNGQPIPYQYNIGLYNNTDTGTYTTISAFTKALEENNVKVLNVFSSIRSISIELPKIVNTASHSRSTFSLSPEGNVSRNTTLADVVNLFLPNNTASILTVFNLTIRSQPIDSIPATNSSEVCQIIKINPNVRYCEPVTIISPFSVNYSDAFIPKHIKRIGAVHNETTDLSNGSMTVAVLDSGIEQNSSRLNVINSISVYPERTNDDCGHGTHVAGIIGAKDIPGNVVGVAPGVNLISVKVIYWHLNPFTIRYECYGSSNDMAEGLQYIIDNADQIDIVNLSGGSNRNDTTLDELTAEAVRRGITFVTAAGNLAKDAKNTSPAHLPDVITVSAIADSDGKCGGNGTSLTDVAGSTNKDDSLATFSNFGKSVVIAAPGVNITSTWPDGSIRALDGTSQAAPQVTGAATLFKLANPNASPAEVKEGLLKIATPPSANCDGYARGHFAGSPNSPPEPLLYVEPLFPSARH